VAEIEVDRRENVLVLPERLVEFRGGRSFVGIPDGRGGRAEKEVRTGLGDGLVVEVLDGLAEGDEVVEKALE
jgi:HlyD family secretion protein